MAIILDGSDAVGDLGDALAAKADIASASAPYRMAAGTIYSGAVSTTVTYPASRFTVPPIVVAINGETVGRTITNGSATSFTYQNAVGSNNTLLWIAIQMTSTTAAG